MKLSIHWSNATRPHEIRTLIELTYRNALLEIADGVEHVKTAYDHARANPRDKFQDWRRFHQYALGSIASRLSMAETKSAKLQIAFEGEKHEP